jgi:hypothetical protein
VGIPPGLLATGQYSDWTRALKQLISAANHDLIMHKIACICIIDKVHACMHMHCIILAFP